jgi:hypothetical protein
MQRQLRRDCSEANMPRDVPSCHSTWRACQAARMCAHPALRDCSEARTSPCSYRDVSAAACHIRRGPAPASPTACCVWRVAFAARRACPLSTHAMQLPQPAPAGGGPAPGGPSVCSIRPCTNPLMQAHRSMRPTHERVATLQPPSVAAVTLCSVCTLLGFCVSIASGLITYSVLSEACILQQCLAAMIWGCFA